MTLTHCKLAGDQYGIYDEDQQTAGAYKAVLGNRDGDGAELAVLFAAAPCLLKALEGVLADRQCLNLSVQTLNSVMTAVDRAKGVSQ